MTVSIRHKLGGSQRSVFSLTLSDESTECSALSWDEDIVSEEDSSGYFSQEDDYLDAQMMKGDFILEKPLELDELDHMVGWGIGVKVTEALPKFNDSINDFAVKLPKRRKSINEDLSLVGQGDSRNDLLASFGRSSGIFSIVSGEFDSSVLDTTLDSDDESDDQTSYYLSKSFTSLLGFEDDADADGKNTPPIAKRTKDKPSLIRQVTSMASLADEDVSIADSAYIVGAEAAKDRWAEGEPQENFNSANSQDSRWTEGAPQEKRSSSGSQDSRWSEDLPPENSQNKVKIRKSDISTMAPPRRRLSDVGDWSISRRESLTSSTVDFAMFNEQIQAEVGLRMSNSLPAQKIMEAIMSVLQNQEQESKQEEMRPQSIVEGTHKQRSLVRAQ